MNNRFVKIITPIIFIALVLFLFGIPHIDNSEIEKKVSLLKSHKNRNDISEKLTSKEFRNLPLSVKKYLNKTIKNKSKNPIVSHITLTGEIKDSPKSDWLDYSSVIYYSATTPNFIEVSEVSKFYFIWDRTINQYINGGASTETKFLSSLKTNSFSGNKLDRSFLIKYLMLSFITPTTLLPNTKAQWKRIDNYSAHATIWDEHKKGNAIFYFNKNNEATKIVSKDRYMPGKIDYSKETFTIHLANYKDIGDYYIPTYFEFQWNLSGGDFTFGKFQITDVTYK